MKSIKEIIDFTIQALIGAALSVASTIGLGYGLINEDATVLLLAYGGFCMAFAIGGFLAIDITE